MTIFLKVTVTSQIQSKTIEYNTKHCRIMKYHTEQNHKKIFRATPKHNGLKKTMQDNWFFKTAQVHGLRNRGGWNIDSSLDLFLPAGKSSFRAWKIMEKIARRTRWGEGGQVLASQLKHTRTTSKLDTHLNHYSNIIRIHFNTSYLPPKNLWKHV